MRGAMRRELCWLSGTAVSMLLAACGSGGSQTTASPPPQPATTAVTLMVTSTANDQLSEFGLTIQGITLTRWDGQTVTLRSPSSSQGAEFIHVNAGAEPLLTVSIPSGLYKAAAVTVGYASFTCVTLVPASPNSEGMDISTYAYGQTPASDVTVTLPAPINVEGEGTGLALDLLVTPSASYAQCGAPGLSPYAIAPTFSLTSFPLSAAPGASQGYGFVTALPGFILSLDPASGSFELQLSQQSQQPSIQTPSTNQATTVRVTSDNATVLQGITGFAALGMGTYVDLDATVQPDGSLHATRIAVADPAAVDVHRGPLLFVAEGTPILELFPRQTQGADLVSDFETFRFDTSTFGISGEMSNLASLPFTPSFNATNMVAGQNVAVSTGSFSFALMNGVGYQAVATTITLMPQTINGQVVGMSSTGGFTIYSVMLAPDDLFPTLAAQSGQTTLLTNPGIVQVYVGTDTVVRSSSAPAAGAELRFYGLVFNDNGVLRMDCATVSDGVTGTSETLSPIT
jgi:hypothetical protein